MSAVTREQASEVLSVYGYGGQGPGSFVRRLQAAFPHLSADERIAGEPS